MSEHVWAEIQMVWTAAGREAVAYSEQGGRLGAGEILTMLNEHAALKRENVVLGTALYHALYEFEYHKNDPRWLNIDVDDERKVAFDVSLR